jgi:hypothetical protein
MSTKPDERSTPGWLGVGAGIVLALALVLAFILRDVLTTGGLPGLESRIFYSSEVYTRSVLATGALPHWNPFYFSGTPHFADAENLVLYPPALALRWLPVPEFMQWMVIVHVLIGVAGMVFLTRTVGAGWLGALVAALTFAAGGTVTSWLHHGHVLLLYCASWLPWALALAIRSTARARPLPHAGLVAVMVLQFLAGYLQGSIYISAVIAAFFLFRVIRPESSEARLARWPLVAQFVVLTVVAGGLAAFQLLPTMQLAAEAGRSAGIDYVVATQNAWRFDDLATLWLPFHGLAEGPVHRYLGDRTAYVGWLPALMVPFAFTRRSFTALAGFFLFLAIVAIALALGDHLGFYRLHYALFPGLRVPGRALFIATMSLGVLGAVGLEQFVALCRSRNWRRMTVPACIGLGWAAVSVAVGMTISPGVAAPMHGWPWLPIFAVTLVGVVAMSSATGRTRLVAVLTASFVVFDLGLFSADAVHAAPVPTGNYWATLPTANGGRVVSTCWMDLGETLESRVSTVDGLANMYLRDYADWASLVKTGDVPRAGALVTKINGLDGTLPVRRDLMDFSSTTTVVACEQLKASGMRERTRIRERYFVYDNQAARPRAFWTCSLEELSRGDVMTRLVRQRYSSDGTLVSVYPISVKWSGALADSERAAIEARYGLGVGEPAGDTVRRYFVSNPDTRQMLTLASEPAADDTNGFDRATGRVLAVEPVGGIERADDREWLVGAHSCAARGNVNVLVQDRADGQIVADVDAPVDGDVYFNEPYFGERRAYVDGDPAETRKANLAFTAVPVKAGHHRVELRLVPTSFYAGAGISGLTLVCSLGVAWRARHHDAHSA